MMFEKRRGWRFKNRMKAIVVWWLFTWTVLLRLTARTVQLFPRWEVNDGAESRAGSFWWASVSGQGYKGTSMCRITTQSCYRDQPFL